MPDLPEWGRTWAIIRTTQVKDLPTTSTTITTTVVLLPPVGVDRAHPQVTITPGDLDQTSGADNTRDRHKVLGEGALHRPMLDRTQE